MGKRALISFLSWLDYCDQLIKEAQKVLNNADSLCFDVTYCGLTWCCFSKPQQCFFSPCRPDSSSSNGQSCEGKILCVCDGTSTHADVSPVLTHLSIIVLCNSSVCYLCRDFFVCLWLHVGPSWASWPPQHCWTGSSGRWPQRLCCNRWFTSC